MPEEHIRYLEMIQQVISRMANNSFFVKGWSLTLVSAIFAVAAQGNTWGLVWTALLPAFVFWGLDTFYLRQERLFRHLYDDSVISHLIDFSIDIRPYLAREPYLKVAFRPAMWPLHVVILVTILIIGVFKTIISTQSLASEKPQDAQVKTTVTCNCPVPTVIVKEVPIALSNATCPNHPKNEHKHIVKCSRNISNKK